MSAVGFLLFLFSRPNFVFVYFGVTVGVMLLSVLIAWVRYGGEAFKNASGEPAKQDFELEKKLKRMKKGYGGF